MSLPSSPGPASGDPGCSGWDTGWSSGETLFHAALFEQDVPENPNLLYNLYVPFSLLGIYFNRKLFKQIMYLIKIV